jgi:hypothetical protein
MKRNISRELMKGAFHWSLFKIVLILSIRNYTEVLVCNKVLLYTIYCYFGAKMNHTHQN